MDSAGALCVCNALHVCVRVCVYVYPAYVLMCVYPVPMAVKVSSSAETTTPNHKQLLIRAVGFIYFTLYVTFPATLSQLQLMAS